MKEDHLKKLFVLHSSKNFQQLQVATGLLARKLNFTVRYTASLLSLQYLHSYTSVNKRSHSFNFHTARHPLSHTCPFNHTLVLSISHSFLLTHLHFHSHDSSRSLPYPFTLTLLPSHTLVFSHIHSFLLTPLSFHSHTPVLPLSHTCHITLTLLTFHSHTLCPFTLTLLSFHSPTPVLPLSHHCH